MLKYALYPNRLTRGEDDYRAIPQSLKNDGIKEVIGQMTLQGSILKETECVAVIHEFFRIISENLKHGRGFISDYIQIQPSIKGVFNGIDDQFDDSRHQKQVNISASKLLKSAIHDMELEKVSAQVNKPRITSVLDYKSGLKDSVITPGHMMEIRGCKLKINTLNDDEGIYLIDKLDDSEIAIESIHENYPGRLLAMIPDALPPGSYYVEVRSRMRKNNHISSGVFPTELSVAQPSQGLA